MAWITPVTDRTNTARLTAEDVNRITGNINYLIATSLKTDWTTNDFLTLTAFNEILSGTKTAALKYGVFIYTEPDTAQTWENYNNIENLLLQCKNVLDFWDAQGVAQKHLNQGIYLNAQYSNYLRGI